MTVDRKVYFENLVRHAQANHQSLLEACSDAMQQRIRTSQLQMLGNDSETFLDRVYTGRIVNGHGDLRPEHICLPDRPAVFDCADFSTGLRRHVDCR